jgi:hypothetical protein
MRTEARKPATITLRSCDMAMFLLFIFLGTAGVFITLGVPLMLGRVRPNALYGFRTEATLRDANVWYPVNRAGGTAIIIGAVAVATAAVVTYVSRVSIESAAAMNLGVTLASVLAAAVHGWRVQRRLQA